MTLTLYEPRLLTTHSNVTSRPIGTVRFNISSANSGALVTFKLWWGFCCCCWCDWWYWCWLRLWWWWWWCCCCGCCCCICCFVDDDCELLLANVVIAPFESANMDENEWDNSATDRVDQCRCPDGWWYWWWKLLAVDADMNVPNANKHKRWKFD